MSPATQPFSKVFSSPTGPTPGENKYCVECCGYVGSAATHASAGHKILHGPAAIQQSARMKLHRVLVEAGCRAL